jgi:hypothetical protein
LALTSFAVVTVPSAISRYLKIFLADFKNNEKKISSPPGQNLDIANSTVGWQL